MQVIQQNQTAFPIVFFLALTSDGKTGATGLTPTVTISKNGGAFSSPAGAVSEISNGWYKLAGNATDANTLGPLLLHATAATADPADVKVMVSDAATAAGILAAVTATVMPESYRADGAAGTLAQIVYELLAHLGESSISGTTKTTHKIDGTTPAATYILDSSTAPTSITRAT